MTPADPAVPVLHPAEIDAASVPRVPAYGVGCGYCGLPAHEHGIHLIRRFVRPVLPAGHPFLDRTAGEDEPSRVSGPASAGRRRTPRVSRRRATPDSLGSGRPRPIAGYGTLRRPRVVPGERVENR